MWEQPVHTEINVSKYGILATERIALSWDPILDLEVIWLGTKC